MNKKLISLTLVLTLLLALFAVPAAAAEQRSSAYLSTYSANVSKTSSGKLSVHFYVMATGQMDHIGANTIYIQRYTGSYWSTEYTYNYPATPSLQTTNATYHSLTLTYTPSDSGSQYRAVVVFYAEKDGDSDSGRFTSNAA